MQVLVLPNT